jgi:hypothetical protein
MGKRTTKPVDKTCLSQMYTCLHKGESSESLNSCCKRGILSAFFRFASEVSLLDLSSPNN